MDNGHIGATHNIYLCFFSSVTAIEKGNVQKFICNLPKWLTFLGFTGIIDVLYFYKVDLPPNLDYAAAFMAFFIEGFLFANHLHGRAHMDVMVCFEALEIYSNGFNKNKNNCLVITRSTHF